MYYLKREEGFLSKSTLFLRNVIFRIIIWNCIIVRISLHVTHHARPLASPFVFTFLNILHRYCDENIWNLLASYRKLVVKLGFTWSRRHKTTDFRVIIHSEKKVVTATAGYSLHTAILECNWHQKNEIGGWFIHTGHKTQTLQIENLLMWFMEINWSLTILICIFFFCTR